jgi:hypothetical protein
MAKGHRANLERLLRSAWQNQQLLQTNTGAELPKNDGKLDWNQVWPLTGIILALASNIFLRGAISIFFWHLFLFIALCWLGIHLLRTKTKSRIAAAVLIVMFLAITVVSAVTEWPEKPKRLTMKAYESPAHPDGDNFGGIVWDGRFHDVRIVINNGNNYPAKDLDLTVHVNSETQTLAGFGQLTTLSNCNFNAVPFAPDFPLTLRGKDGTKATLSPRDYGQELTRHYGVEWKMFCSVVPSGFEMRLALAAIQNADGTVPEKITLSGSYEATSRNVNETISVDEVLSLQ